MFAFTTTSSAAAEILPKARPPRRPIRVAPQVTGQTDALAVLAHDLRGPLANLSLLIEAMAAETGARLGNGNADRAQKALKVIERVDAMLTAMLDRAGNSTATLAAARRECDLADFIEEVLTLNRPLAERQRVRLHGYIAEPLSAFADPELVMQAIDNLLNNAIGFTGPGGLVLLEAMPDGEGGVTIQVTDQGPGLTAGEIDQLFQRFSRPARNSRSGRRSTGLGLWIVRCIAELHAGKADVRSGGPGKGATFRLWLPAQRQ